MKDQTKAIVYTIATIVLIVAASIFVYAQTRQSILDDPRSTEDIIQELDPQTHCEEILGGTFIVEPNSSSICVIDE